MTAAAGDEARPGGTIAGRLGRLLRVEDLLLFGWLVLVNPILLADPAAGSGSGSDPLRGMFGIVALGGLVVCVGARAAPGVTSGLAANGEVLWVVGPLVGAIGFALADTGAALGLGDAGNLLVVALIALGIGARIRLPALDAPTRRTLVTPFVLVTSGYFGEFITGLVDLFDLRQLGPAIVGQPNAGFAIFLLAMAVLGVLAFYVMLVFAPRQVAEREGGALAWTARFLVYLVGLVLGATWAGIILR